MANMKTTNVTHECREVRGERYMLFPVGHQNVHETNTAVIVIYVERPVNPMEPDGAKFFKELARLDGWSLCLEDMMIEAREWVDAKIPSGLVKARTYAEGLKYFKDYSPPTPPAAGYWWKYA